METKNILVTENIVLTRMLSLASLDGFAAVIQDLEENSLGIDVIPFVRLTFVCDISEFPASIPVEYRASEGFNNQFTLPVEQHFRRGDYRLDTGNPDAPVHQELRKRC